MKFFQAVLFFTASLCVMASSNANATALPADLSISTSTKTDPAAFAGGLSFDETNSLSATGIATHTGSLVQTIGGTSTTTTVDDVMITGGTNPLTGTLTEMGDGWEIHSAIGGSFAGSSSNNGGSFYDLFFSLQNLSGTDSIQVMMTLDFSNLVEAAGPDGFASSEIQLFDSSPTDLFFFRYSVGYVPWKSV